MDFAPRKLWHAVGAEVGEQTSEVGNDEREESLANWS
jgi:hypothetical protein